MYVQGVLYEQEKIAFPSGNVSRTIARAVILSHYHLPFSRCSGLPLPKKAVVLLLLCNTACRLRQCRLWLLSFMLTTCRNFHSLPADEVRPPALSPAGRGIPRSTRSRSIFKRYLLDCLARAGRNLDHSGAEVCSTYPRGVGGPSSFIRAINLGTVFEKIPYAIQTQKQAEPHLPL